MKRIAWIDYGKSLAIFLVVLLHVNCNHEVVKVINGFIMPLFFLMSGYLFRIDRTPSYKVFVAAPCRLKHRLRHGVACAAGRHLWRHTPAVAS